LLAQVLPQLVAELLPLEPLELRALGARYPLLTR
jgi:hypothetical protein